MCPYTRQNIFEWQPLLLFLVTVACLTFHVFLCEDGNILLSVQHANKKKKSNAILMLGHLVVWKVQAVHSDTLSKLSDKEL